MLNGRKVAVVMPAYNAAVTLERTLRELPADVVDDTILVDDASHDETVELAGRLGIHTVRHPANLGYGGNQKTCYRTALARAADIVVMVHPDYQYSPNLVAAMASMIAYGEYDMALGSRILTGSAARSGMPRWKYVANRGLTLIQNVLMGLKLSEFHTGFRAFSSQLLRALPLETNSNDFVFDSQMIAQAANFGCRIGELSCPSRYFAEASSITFRRSVKYGFGCLDTAIAYRMAKWRMTRPSIFSDSQQLRLD